MLVVGVIVTVPLPVAFTVKAKPDPKPAPAALGNVTAIELFDVYLTIFPPSVFRIVSDVPETVLSGHWLASSCDPALVRPHPIAS